jgi:hypothetical protein
MPERRSGRRLLCAHLVTLVLDAGNRKGPSVLANLEDISTGGACLQMDQPIPIDAKVRLICASCEFRGRVRHCQFREIGYYAGIQFEAGNEWSVQKFVPDHLLDPAALAASLGATGRPGRQRWAKLIADLLDGAVRRS